MTRSKLRILIYLTISLTLLFAPVLLEISSDGNTYAMGWLRSSPSDGGSSGSRIAKSPESPHPGSNPVASVPEPAIMLLVGGGVLGLAALRKKFKKK